MATVEDILRTRMEVAGLGGYVRSFTQASSALGIFKKDLEDADRAQLALGVASGAAALAIVGGLGRATLVAGEHQAILQRVSLSYQQFGQNVPQSALEAFGNRMQDTTAVARDQAVAISGLYAEYGLGERQAEQLTQATLNAAEALKARGLSATTVATRIGIALERARMGESAAFSRLSQIGIPINRAKAAIDPFNAALDALNEKGGNQAAMFRNTLPGSIDAFRNSMLRLGQDVGGVTSGPLTALVNLGTRLLDLLDRFPVATAAVAGAAAIGFGANAVGRILPLVAGARAVFAGVAAKGVGAVAAGGAAAYGPATIKMIMRSFGVNEAEATAIAAENAAAAGVYAGAGAARTGTGGRALGFLKGPMGLGLAAAGAFGISEASRGNQGVLGQLGFIGGRAGAGALAGAALTGGNPWGVAIGGAVGVAEALYERLNNRQGGTQEARNATDSLVRSNEDLRAAINGLNQKIDQLVGNQDIRDVLGDSRLVAAFARGIA